MFKIEQNIFQIIVHIVAHFNTISVGLTGNPLLTHFLFNNMINPEEQLTSTDLQKVEETLKIFCEISQEDLCIFCVKYGKSFTDTMLLTHFYLKQQSKLDLMIKDGILSIAPALHTT